MSDGRNGRRLASIVVRSMKQLMSFVRIRLSQELVIKLFDHRIVVRLTNRTVFIGAFQDFEALRSRVQIVASETNRAAAVDASARTSHHFDKVIVAGSRGHFITDLVGVGETVNDCDFQLHASFVHFRFFINMRVVGRLKGNVVHLFSREDMVKRS